MLLRGNCNAWEWKIINMVSCSLPLIIIRKGLTLKRRSLPWVFYPLGISISSVKTSGDEILSLISIQEWIFVTKKMWSFSVRLFFVLIYLFDLINLEVQIYHILQKHCAVVEREMSPLCISQKHQLGEKLCSTCIKSCNLACYSLVPYKG